MKQHLEYLSIRQIPENRIFLHITAEELLKKICATLDCQIKDIIHYGIDTSRQMTTPWR